MLLDRGLELLGDLAVALVEVREGLGDVPLHHLELRANHLDPVQGGGLRNLLDRLRSVLHRLAGATLGLGQVAQVVLEPRGAHRDRLEPLVARREQRPNRLVLRDDRHDPFLLGTDILCRGAPHLAGDLPHQGGGGALHLIQPGLHPLVDRRADQVVQPRLLLGGRRTDGGLTLLATGEQPTLEDAGLLLCGGRRFARVHIDASLVWGPRSVSVGA